MSLAVTDQAYQMQGNFTALFYALLNLLKERHKEVTQICLCTAAGDGDSSECLSEALVRQGRVALLGVAVRGVQQTQQLAAKRLRVHGLQRGGGA